MTVLKPHVSRKITIMKKDDPRVPKALFEIKSVAPDLEGFPYPLPSKKSDYTCFAEGNNSVFWYGGKSGLTRYDSKTDCKADKIMFFSACRHLADNKIDALLAEGDNVWALTGDEVSYIEMPTVSCEQKADILHEETKKYVQRRGMVSQKDLRIPRDLESRYPYASCDNDGLFTSGYAMAEMFHYATLRRELGEDHPKTKQARADATLGCEACLLLMYIHGRPEGFIARSYHVGEEPVPDDGHFYKRQGDKAICVETTCSKKSGRAGEEYPAGYPIPDRLEKLYRDLGYTDDDVTYKADTSSDEVTGHFLQMRYAHDILGPDDPELDELIKDAAKRTTAHIIKGGFEFLESSGKPTTWAKWSRNYFENDDIGYCDAPLNASEMLMFLKLTMYITGEEGLWKETYDKLIAEGYAELGPKHFDRFFQCSTAGHLAPEEDLMYGDNTLAVLTFWQLCTLEKDEKLLEIYRNAFKSWKGTILREHTPGFDFMYKMGCPDEEIDMEKDVDWFNNFELSRLCGSVHMSDRHDVPRKIPRGGDREVSALLPLAEIPISKFDRNPFSDVEFGYQPGTCVESCYVFTYSYWLGRYFGFISEEE
ncbi:MAG: hypothetical protein MJ168_01190 [Clostridia bacterium]|nr:hypothetical protein [Clostridia bacterium]